MLIEQGDVNRLGRGRLGERDWSSFAKIFPDCVPKGPVGLCRDLSDVAKGGEGAKSEAATQNSPGFQPWVTRRSEIRPESISNPPRRMQFGEGARPRAPRRTCQNPALYSCLRLLSVLGFGNNPAAAGRGCGPSPRT